MYPHLKKILLLVILVVFTYFDCKTYLDEKNVKSLKIIKSFPTEEQMNKDNFAMHQGVNFSLSQDSLYFCDQLDHEIIQFDLNGNYIRTIGKNGQGPGEFQYPLYVFIYNNKLYVTDNRNSRIQRFSLEGKYEEQLKLFTTFGAFVIVEDKLIICNPRGTKDYNRENADIFEIYNMEGELENKIKGSFYSPYKDFRIDNSLTVRTQGDSIHCLQQYGTTYRVYNYNGDLIKEFELDFNPLNDNEYKKIKYMYTYQNFCINEDKIFAPIAWEGKLMIFVFDLNGKYLYRYENLMKQKKEIYDIYCIDIIQKNSRKYIYILVESNDLNFVIAEFE